MQVQFEMIVASQSMVILNDCINSELIEDDILRYRQILNDGLWSALTKGTTNIKRARERERIYILKASSVSWLIAPLSIIISQASGLGS